MRRTNTILMPHTTGCWGNRTQHNRNKNLDEMSWQTPPISCYSWFTINHWAACSTPTTWFHLIVLWIKRCGTFGAICQRKMEYASCSVMSCNGTSSRLWSGSFNMIPFSPFLHKIHSKRANVHQVVKSICTFFVKEPKHWQKKQTKKPKTD